MPALQTFEYTIAFNPALGAAAQTVRAAYFTTGGDELGSEFVEFKDANHAPVHAVRSAHVLSIHREGLAPVSLSDVAAALEARPTRTSA